MAISKIILNGVTQMDVTDDTVASNNLLSGEQATGANGQKVTGNIASKTSSNVTVSGDTVTVPAGHYASQVTKSVASGTAGTPTATKGSVSNHSVSVTPSVTNTTGYITGGTKTGTAVTVSASELVSGTLSISSSGTKDVTNYASASVAAGTEGTPTATKGTVSNNSVSVTPSVTNTTGYITGGTKTGTAVTVSASELVSGTKSISQNGTGIDVTNFASVDVSVSGGGSSTYTLTNIVPTQTIATTTSNLYGYVGLIPTYTEYVQSGEWYLVTYDNNEYVVTGYYGANSEILIGDYQLITSNVEWLETPFMVEHNLTNGYFFLGTRVSGNHTLKVDKIEFIDDGVTLIGKTITANGTYNASSDNADGYSSVTVNVSGGGGGSAEPKDVNFIDYDGTILYSYTKAEALALDALPSNPSHSGLTSQGWNYTLAQIKTECNSVGKCTVGQMYVTQSGDTEIDVKFVDAARLSPYISFAVNGTVEIDWGDNSAKDTVTGTSLISRKSTQHVYSAVGDYTIKIHVVSGTWNFYGTPAYSLLNKNSSTANVNRVYSNCVQNIRIGNNTGIGNYAFANCYSLASITIPSSVTSLGTDAFYYCYSLAFITIPSSVTSLGTDAFYYCYIIATVIIPSSVTSLGTYAFYNSYSLKSIAIPSGVTSIGASAFQNCYCLASVTIPSGVTSIGASAFQNCYGMAEYHFKPTTPPTLENTNAFNSIQSDCKIYVPSASLSAYQTETNWSTYASYMVGE